MPRPSKTSVLARLGEATMNLVREVLDAVLPKPEPDRIPVRVRERR